MDICCSIVNSYPAYIAGAVGVCSVGELALGVFYFAKLNSPFLDNVFLNDPYFEVGPFSFALSESIEHDEEPDYYVYQVTLGAETYTCLLGFVDTVTVPCGSASNINFTEFLWDNTVVFSFQKYGIVAVPLDSPRILYLQHHGAESSGWTQSSLCQRCARHYQPQTYPFLPQCTASASSSCKCNVCVRQPPSLRSLASYTVFHITENLSEFTLTADTLYDNYIHAVQSNLVPEDRLIPFTFPHLRCAFARGLRSSTRRRFHKTCVDPTLFPWFTHTGEYCNSKAEVIERLRECRHEYWCDVCNKPLFATTDCLFC